MSDTLAAVGEETQPGPLRRRSDQRLYTDRDVKKIVDERLQIERDRLESSMWMKSLDGRIDEVKAHIDEAVAPLAAAQQTWFGNVPPNHAAAFPPLMEWWYSDGDIARAWTLTMRGRRVVGELHDQKWKRIAVWTGVILGVAGFLIAVASVVLQALNGGAPAIAP